jgi:hypothetical protein
LSIEFLFATTFCSTHPICASQSTISAVLTFWQIFVGGIGIAGVLTWHGQSEEEIVILTRLNWAGELSTALGHVAFEDVLGVLVEPVSASDATLRNQDDIADRIAIVERAVSQIVTLEAQVCQALKAGAVAVLVVSSSDYTPAPVRGNDTGGATIPVFAITKAQGASVVRALMRDRSLKVSLNVPYEEGKAILAILRRGPTTARQRTVHRVTGAPAPP